MIARLIKIVQNHLIDVHKECFPTVDTQRPLVLFNRAWFASNQIAGKQALQAMTTA